MKAIPRGLVVASLITVLLWGVAQARPFLVPLSIAALLAFLIAPIVRLLRRFFFPEWLGIAIAMIVLLLPFSGLGFLIISQGQALLKDFPKIVASLDRTLTLSPYLRSKDLLHWLTGTAGQGIQILITSIATLIDAGSQTGLVLLFTVLLLISRFHLRESVLRIFHRADTHRILEETSLMLQRFLVARMVIAVSVGVVDLTILVIAHLPYPYLLATFLAVMTVVPVIGFFISVIPPIAVSLALGHSVGETLGLFGALAVVSAIEGNVLSPKLVGRQLQMNALAIFVGFFGGGLLWGIWGMLLSIPVLGVLRIVLRTMPNLSAWSELLGTREITLAAPQRGSGRSRKHAA